MKRQQLIIGSTNAGKIAYFKTLFQDTPIDIIGLEEGKITPPEECGKDVNENAIAKSNYYYDQLKIPVVSADTGLYFQSVTEDEQPGLFVRRIGKLQEEATDEEMIEHYGQLIKKYGGELIGEWTTTIALTDESGTVSSNYIDLSVFTDIACAARQKGLPLASLQLDEDGITYRAERFKKELKYVFDEALKELVLTHFK